MDELLRAINGYLTLLCYGVILALNAVMRRRDRGVTGQPAACTTAPSEPARVLRLISSVAVDPSHAEKFLADNPEMLTTDQSRRALNALGVEHAGWLVTFNLMLATARAQNPGMAYLFRLELSPACVRPDSSVDQVRGGGQYRVPL